MKFCNGIPRNFPHPDGNNRFVKIGKDLFTQVNLKPVTPSCSNLTFSYYHDERPSTRYTFGYYLSLIPETDNYVLVQAAVSICRPEDRFERSIGRSIVTDTLADPNLLSHLAFATHFPVRSLIKTGYVLSFPGSRLLQKAIQSEILDNYFENLDYVNQDPEVILVDE